MGIRFCNEVVVASQQLNPPVAGKEDPDKVEVIEGMTDIDEGGVHVSGQPGGTKEYTAVPFVINLGSFSPPSVRLIPCRPYMVGTCCPSTFSAAVMKRNCCTIFWLTGCPHRHGI